MLEAHWEEITHFKDIPLSIDVDAYMALEAVGVLRVFTARDETSDQLAGYAVFVVKGYLHHKESIHALQDIFYIDPNYRGRMLGLKFFKWCDETLRDEGVQVVCHFVKAAHDFGPMLERIGYELSDLMYVKRLDTVSGEVGGNSLHAMEIR